MCTEKEKLQGVYKSPEEKWGAEVRDIEQDRNMKRKRSA
jgi:hypothetical protein